MKLNVLVILLFGVLTSRVGVAQPRIDIEGMDKAYPNLECLKTQTFLALGSLSCTENVEQIKAHTRACIGIRLLYQQNPPEALYALHAYINLVFDRELMMVNRLKPSRLYKSEWDNFEQKWRKRLKDHPELRQIDQAEELVTDAVGSFEMRINSIESRRRAADRDDERYLKMFNGRRRNPGFLAMTADLMVSALDSKIAKSEFLRRASDDEKLAKQMITEEKDKIMLVFPELERIPGAFGDDLVVARIWERVDIEELGRVLMKRGEADRFLSTEERFDTFAKYLSARFGDSKVIQEHLTDVDNIFVRLANDLHTDLDLSVEAALLEPKRLLENSFIVGVTMAELTESNPILKQDLVGLQCSQVYADARWQHYNYLNKKYGGYVLVGSLIAMVLGGGEAVLGWAGLRLLSTRLMGPVALARMTPIFNGMVRTGGVLLNYSGRVMTIVGTPSSGFALSVYYKEYNKAARAFYENSNVNNVEGRASAVQPARADVQREAFSLLLFLSPLLWGGPLF